MDSHASQVRELIDQRLDWKLTAFLFQDQIAAMLRQAQSLTAGKGGQRAEPLQEEMVSTDTSSSTESSKKKKRRRKKKSKHISPSTPQSGGVPVA